LLRDPEYLMYKRTYPPVVPLVETIWALVFGWNEVKMKWFFIACWVSVGILIFSVLKKRGNYLTAWVGSCMWFLLPYNVGHFHGGAISGFADIPFAMALLCAIFVVKEFHSSKNTVEIMFMSILIAGTFWIKREGLIFTVLVFGYLIWQRVNVKTLMMAAFVAVVFYGIHLLTISDLPKFLEQDLTLNLSFSEIGRRLGKYPGLLLEEMRAGDHWGHRLWYLFLAGWLVKALCIKKVKFFNIKAYFLFSLAFIYSVFLLLTVWDFETNMKLGFHRLLIQLYPLLIIARFDGIERGCDSITFSFARKDKSTRNT